MKKKLLGKNARKALFIIGCVLIAFAFWYVVEYNELSWLCGVTDIC